MKFKSALVTQASGSIGGLTASRNRGGMYMRARAVPVNPNTPFQQVARAVMAFLVTNWLGGLSAEERDGWESYASQVPVIDRLGDPRYISGLSMYLRCNSARMQAGLSRVDEAPVLFIGASLTPPGDLIVTDGDEDNIAIQITNTDDWATAVGGALLVYASRPVNATINGFKGPFRFTGLVLGAGTPPVALQQFNAPFERSQGQRIFVRFVAVTSDGRISAEQIQTAIVEEAG